MNIESSHKEMSSLVGHWSSMSKTLSPTPSTTKIEPMVVSFKPGDGYNVYYPFYRQKNKIEEKESTYNPF